MKLDTIINGTVYLQASLKAFELSDRTLEDKYHISVRELNYEDDRDMEMWCNLIHNSYDDCYFTIDSARMFLKSHSVFENMQTFVYQDINGGGYLQRFQ